MTSNFVSAHGSHYAQIWMKGVDIKNPLFSLVYLRLLVHPPVGHMPQYRLCGLFMIMKHSCDDINYHE